MNILLHYLIYPYQCLHNLAMNNHAQLRLRLKYIINAVFTHCQDLDAGLPLTSGYEPLAIAPVHLWYMNLEQTSRLQRPHLVQKHDNIPFYLAVFNFLIPGNFIFFSSCTPAAWGAACCQLTNSHDVQLSLRYSDRRLHCDGRLLTSAVCDVQQRRQWLACPLLDVAPSWLTWSSSATTTIYCSQ